MGLFSSILEKLGLKKPEEEKKPLVSAAPVAPKPKPIASPANSAAIKPNATIAPGPSQMGAMKPTVVAMSEVDVVNKLDGLAKVATQKLDWKVSIVDLLKLLDLDSSLSARKELATELGCPKEKMGGDFAEMNVWLHKEVLKRIAANGGNIPKELL